MGRVWHLWGEGKAENCWDSGPGQGSRGRRGRPGGEGSLAWLNLGPTRSRQRGFP